MKNAWPRMVPAGVVVLLCVIGPLQAAAVAAAEDAKTDDSKARQGIEEVQKGGKQVGEGVADTAKGVGQTVVGGAEVAGEKVKDAGEAAKPAAKSAWSNVRDGAVAFGHSVKTFFSRLFSTSSGKGDERKGS